MQNGITLKNIDDAINTQTLNQPNGVVHGHNNSSLVRRERCESIGNPIGSMKDRNCKTSSPILNL